MTPIPGNEPSLQAGHCEILWRVLTVCNRAVTSGRREKTQEGGKKVAPPASFPHVTVTHPLSRRNIPDVPIYYYYEEYIILLAK